AVVSFVCVLLAVAVAWLFRSGYFALQFSLVAAAVLGATGASSLVLQILRRRAAAVNVLAGGFIAFNYLFVAALLPDVERLNPVPTLAQAFNKAHAPNPRV